MSLVCGQYEPSSALHRSHLSCEWNGDLLIYRLLLSVSMSSITPPDSHAHLRQVQALARAQKHAYKWLRTSHQYIVIRQRSIWYAIIDGKLLGWQTESNTRLVDWCRKGGRGASHWDGCSKTPRVGARIVEPLFRDWTCQGTGSDKVDFFVMMTYCYTNHLAWYTPPDEHLQAIAKCGLWFWKVWDTAHLKSICDGRFNVTSKLEQLIQSHPLFETFCLLGSLEPWLHCSWYQLSFGD